MMSNQTGFTSGELFSLDRPIRLVGPIDSDPFFSFHPIGNKLGFIDFATLVGSKFSGKK